MTDHPRRDDDTLGSDSDSYSPTRDARNRTWRYLFNRVGDLVAVRDPRGCGQDFFYDHAARLVAEAYIACQESLAVTEDANLTLPAQAIGLEPVAAGAPIDVLYSFDALPSWASAIPGRPASVYRGRLAGTEDRGQRSAMAYDDRGQVTWSARQMTVLPLAIPPFVSTVDGLPQITESSPPFWTRTFDDAHTYTRTATYDHGGRPTAMTLPLDPDYDDGPAPTIGGTLEYNPRGLPSRVNLTVGSASRAIVDELMYTRDGLVEQVTYGDDLTGSGGSRTPTVSFTTYDDRRRPVRMRTNRTPNAHPEITGRPLEDVSSPHDQMLVWDLADNLIAIEDLRDPTEWPDGFRPQSVHVTHDSLYRVAGAEYEYTTDTGTRTPTDASSDWRAEMEAGRGNDPMRTAPPPTVSRSPETRVASMQWEHDWLGNMQSWDDDAAVFYERSLGEIVNGADLPSSAASRRTGALYVASNLPATPVTADDGGWVEVRYGEDGNALAVTVHGQCGDTSLNSVPLNCRPSGSSDPAEAIALSCAYSCAVEQHFTYAWDEVNRIAHARRFDRTGGASWELAVEQRYLYDASNQRTVKTTTFRGLESGAERTALYVYPGDYERRGLQTTFDRTSYEAISADTETQYGVGGARIVWRTGTRDDGLDRDQRITISLTDLIQSTTAVIDLATGELVETGSYYANGARETYRSNESEAVTPEPMGFTGKEADEELGLTYFGQRYLMAHLGRWASPDPLQTHALGGGEPINGYHYVGGNTLQARDPVGLTDEPTPADHAAAQPILLIEHDVLDAYAQRTGHSLQSELTADLHTLLGIQVRFRSVGADVAVTAMATEMTAMLRAETLDPDGAETEATHAFDRAVAAWLTTDRPDTGARVELYDERLAAGTELQTRSPFAVAMPGIRGMTAPYAAGISFRPDTYTALRPAAGITPLESRLTFGAAMQLTHELMHPGSYSQVSRAGPESSEWQIERDLNQVRQMHGLVQRATGVNFAIATNTSRGAQLEFFRGEYMGDTGYESFQADSAPREVWPTCNRDYCR